MELWDWIFVIHFLLRPSDYTMGMTLPVHKTVCGQFLTKLETKSAFVLCIHDTIEYFPVTGTADLKIWQCYSSNQKSNKTKHDAQNKLLLRNVT